MNNTFKIFEPHEIYQLHIDNGDPETFIIGELLNVFEDGTILIQQISVEGSWDGLCLLWRDDIVRVDINTQYIEKLKVLLPSKQNEQAPPSLKNTGIETLLAYAQEKNEVIAVELLQSGLRNIVGFVEDYDADLVKILLVDEFGRKNGISFFEANVITRIFCADSELKCLKILWNAQIK